MWLRYMPQRLQLFCLDDKKSSKQNVSYKELVYALSKVVGFLRVLRFLPSRKVDRVVWVIKIMTDPQKAF